MTSIFNLRNATKMGGSTFKFFGGELMGTVVRHNVNPKTVTVLCSFIRYEKKFKKYYTTTKKYQVHDETQFCVSGDKVLISQAQQAISKTKSYYVKRVVKAFERCEYNLTLTESNQLQYKRNQ